MPWTSEAVFHSAESFYFSLFQDIQASQGHVDLETYIFDAGRFSDELFLHLQEAVARGVKVRLLVDAVGSWHWLNRLPILAEGIQLRTYHPLSKLFWINRRNHKKVYLVDRMICFVGSLNITDASFQWRESGARVSGSESEKLALAFDKIWAKSKSITPNKVLAHKKLRSKAFYSEDVRLNHSFRLRRRAQQNWLETLRAAQYRVWITTPYFVPTRRQRAVLRSLVRRGVDVQILIPSQSDLPWMMPLSYLLLRDLIRHGEKVFEYLPRVLHAKTVLIDSTAYIGSSNWNHRSWLWDLEVDVRLTHPESILSLEHQFREDLTKSSLLLETKSLVTSYIFYIAARLLWLFRRFL